MWHISVINVLLMYLGFKEDIPLKCQIVNCHYQIEYFTRSISKALQAMDTNLP